MSSVRKEIPVSHFYFWDKIPEELHLAVMIEFADNGCRHLTLPWQLLLLFHRKETGFRKNFLDKVHAAGLSILEAHAPCGAGLSLNSPDPALRDTMLNAHLDCMRIAADAGAGTYTVHIETRPYMDMEQPMGELVEMSTAFMIRSLEHLLPEAEKLGLILTIENCFSPMNTAEQLLRCLNAFNSPFLKCCFDAGHANYMRSGKTWEKLPAYHRVNTWRGKIDFDDHVLEKLAPFVATTHFHDNDGYSDQHRCPGDGTVEWGKIIPVLKQCPCIRSFQNETNALENRVSIARMCRTMMHLDSLGNNQP